MAKAVMAAKAETECLMLVGALMVMDSPAIMGAMAEMRAMVAKAVLAQRLGRAELKEHRELEETREFGMACGVENIGAMLARPDPKAQTVAKAVLFREIRILPNL